MSAAHIFKMELFKYMKDKSYLIATGILAMINIILTIYFTFQLDNINHTSSEGPLFGFMILLFVITMFANTIFMFFYPFHLMAMDYRNNVMAMLVASGVNRTRLFFAKIGATLLWSICLTVTLIFVPATILAIKASQIVGFSTIFEQILSVFHMSGLSIVSISVSTVVGYINSLVLIATATIMMQGKNLTILLFFGLSMVQGFITNLFSMIPLGLNMSLTGIFMFNMLITSLITVGYIFVSLGVMKHQNM